MIVTYRNKKRNVYVVDHTMERYHLTLLPFVLSEQDTIKLDLNRVFHDKEYKPVNLQTYKEKKLYGVVTYAPSINE